MYKLPKSKSQLSYVSETIIEFKIFMLEAYHKLNLYDIADEFKIDVVEASHKLIYMTLQMSSKLLWWQQIKNFT